ncbi:hypothetical protein [Leptolyngbya sp. NIES-2104]|uniref:hypothetical protein n=1 Tax=Leptolyngbya sp. NIES-2104 TaxID=1552121 RepID=UPI0006EC8529|nr:hypothetical protein [Leptolyngbya sp. NIES-2104]GAP99622.1 hypothetical protein NIES2104_61880 [Leptolyngbya sp. NIES-2104]
MRTIYCYQRIKNQIWKWGCCAIVMFLLWAATPPIAGATLLQVPVEIAQLQSTTSIFESILEPLRRTKIPLRLPTQISLKLPIHAVLWNASSQSYQIALTTRPDCRSNYCRNGLISAEKLLSNTPSIKSEYAFLNDPAFRPIERSPDPFGSISLASGIQGFFVPWVLGANYSDAKVIWEQSGYRYTVSLKKGDRQTLIDMANSAINSSP